MKFIHKALNHMSPVISSVAKLSIQNPWSNCGGNYCHKRYEYNMHEDVSAKFLVKHKLINTSQHGFLKARSCLTNILCFFEEITKWVDDGSAVDVVYLHFQKVSIKCHIKYCYLN